MKCWYVISVQPGKSRLAEIQLRNQQFEHFNPVHNVSYGRGSRFAERREPLFPGYMFVRLDEDAGRWRAVNGTLGVKKLISFGNRPAKISSGFVNSLMALVDDDGDVNHTVELKPGQSVELLTGPFAGKIGELLELNGRGRVVVLLQMLSHIPIQTEQKNLLPVN